VPQNPPGSSIMLPTTTAGVERTYVLGGHPKPAIKGHFKTGQR
jgi:hypothetical protein